VEREGGDEERESKYDIAGDEERARGKWRLMVLWMVCNNRNSEVTYDY
jgi:hypothetical protein